MKRLYVLFFFLITISQAQTSTVPSSSDLQDIFRKIISGKVELMTTISAIGKNGDAIIPSLQTLLNTPPLQSKNEVENMRQRRGWYFCAMILEQIGTVNAYSVIENLAQSYQDNEVRGFAMNSLADTYHFKCISDSIQPDTSVLHILVLSIDDTTHVSIKENTIGNIARNGMIRWTGLDFGEDIRKVPGIHGTITQVPADLRKDRELWWQTIGSKLKWNPLDGWFE